MTVRTYPAGSGEELEWSEAFSTPAEALPRSEDEEGAVVARRGVGA
jgi:hypothetical protein